MFFTLLIPHLAETAVGVQGYHFERGLNFLPPPWDERQKGRMEEKRGRFCIRFVPGISFQAEERERSMMHGEGHRSSSDYRRREQKGEDLLQLFPAAAQD